MSSLTRFPYKKSRRQSTPTPARTPSKPSNRAFPTLNPGGKARQTPSDTLQSHSTALSLHRTPEAKRANPSQTPSRATLPRFPYTEPRRQSALTTIRHTPEPSDRAFPTPNPGGKARRTPEAKREKKWRLTQRPDAILWRWADSNRRPNTAPDSFLHA